MITKIGQIELCDFSLEYDALHVYKHLELQVVCFMIANLLSMYYNLYYIYLCFLDYMPNSHIWTMFNSVHNKERRR